MQVIHAGTAGESPEAFQARSDREAAERESVDLAAREASNAAAQARLAEWNEDEAEIVAAADRNVEADARARSQTTMTPSDTPAPATEDGAASRQIAFPHQAAGFIFDGTVPTTRAKCASLGGSLSPVPTRDAGIATWFVCSRSEAGVPGEALLAFCGGKLCALTIVGDTGTGTVTFFQELSGHLSEKYGRANMDQPCTYDASIERHGCYYDWEAGDGAVELLLDDERITIRYYAPTWTTSRERHAERAREQRRRNL